MPAESVGVTAASSWEIDVELPTFEHVIYIPGVLLVGLTIGYVLGARAVRAEFKRLKDRAKE